MHACNLPKDSRPFEAFWLIVSPGDVTVVTRHEKQRRIFRLHSRRAVSCRSGNGKDRALGASNGSADHAHDAGICRMVFDPEEDKAGMNFASPFGDAFTIEAVNKSPRSWYTGRLQSFA